MTETGNRPASETEAAFFGVREIVLTHELKAREGQTAFYVLKGEIREVVNKALAAAVLEEVRVCMMHGQGVRTDRPFEVIEDDRFPDRLFVRGQTFISPSA